MAGPLGEARWAVVRRLYEGDELTVEEICTLAGIAGCTLARHARRGGWDRRPSGGRAVVRSRSREQLAAAGTGGPLDLIGQAALPGRDDGAAVAAVDRLALVRRLWAALDRHMADEEAGLHGPDPRRPQMLDVMVRTIERLSAIEGSGAATSEAPGAGAADEAQLRAELLRRIEALAEET